MASTMKKYRVCGSSPVHDPRSGQSVPPGEPIVLTDEEAKFPLQIGAVELAPDADGARPFNTMATDRPFDQ